MLRNTEAQIETVGEMDLVPGKTYLIQSIREGTRRGRNRINIWNDLSQEEANDYYTRFRGKFIRTVGGDSIVNAGAHNVPEFPSRWNMALFENLEIVSRDKTRLANHIYIITPIPNTDKFTSKSVGGMMHTDDGRLLPYTVATEAFLTALRNNNNIVGFLTNYWSFAESSSEIQKEMETKTLGHLAYSRPNPNDSIDQQRLTNLRGRVVGEGLMGSEIAGYLGTSVPAPTESQMTQMTNNRNTLTGSKRKRDEVEGGRKRTRRNKKRKGRTRKGKSRKGTTMKRRHRYRK